MHAAVLFLLVVAAVTALPTDPDRIVGGSNTNIEQYPYQVALLTSATGATYSQSCGGTIINNRSVLTAAHCFMTRNQLWQWRSRVGSTFANSGGVVYNSQQFIHHPNFNTRTMDMDFSIIRISGVFSFSNSVRSASIAGANYNLGDNQVVWATGWGALCSGCAGSNTLQHVQIWTVNHEVCRQRYAAEGYTLTNNMICSGWLDVGGRDQCQGDSGGPLIHNGVVVGVCSWGLGCALPRFPGVNARVSSGANWIISNA